MPLTSKDKRNLVMAYITVFMDVINFSLIVPILPFITKELNATPMESGILFSGYCIFQLISLYIMGFLSDIYGRKLFLIFSLFGSCFGSIMQALSRNIWELIIYRSLTGLFAGSVILVQAVIADLTTPEERNKFYSRLEATTSAAFILGPALGGILSKNLKCGLMCSFVAGIVSGIAMLFSFFFLQESNKDVLTSQQLRKSAKKLTGEEKEKMMIQYKSSMRVIKLNRKQASPHISKLMVLCFAFEFCNRWAVNAYDAKFGIFLEEKHGITSSVFSIYVCVTSILSCLQQAFVYPYFVGKLGVSIPKIALFGVIVETIAYFLMGWSPSIYVGMLGGALMWTGFTYAAATSASILSTSNMPEIQGKILSWNNLFSQFSLIASPLILSAIYNVNHDATFYFCMIFSMIATIVVSYMICLPNSNRLGKSGNIVANKQESKEDGVEHVVCKEEELTVISQEGEVSVVVEEKSINNDAITPK